MRVPVRIYKTSGGGQYDVPGEGDVVAWIKKEGDHVKKGDPVCELETDKGVVEIVSPADGIVVEIAYPVDAGKPWVRGEVAEIIGDTPYYDPPFCWIETDEVVILPMPQSVPAEVVLAKKSKPRITLAVSRLMEKHVISIDDMLLRFPHATVFTETEIDAVLSERCADLKLPGFAAEEPATSSMVTAVPLARMRSKELGIELALIRGTGPDGLILAADVEAHASQQKIAVLPAHGAWESGKEEPVLLEMSRLWRTIAINMEESQRIPTVDTIAVAREFDFAPLVDFYKRYKAAFPSALWFPVMTAAARVLAKEEFIVFNSYCYRQDDSHFFVAARRRVHMGLSYDRGKPPVIDWDKKTIGGEALRILVIRDAHAKTVKELICDIQRLFKSVAQGGTPDLGDVTGYTSIFNNIGAIGHYSGRSLLGKDIGCQLNLGHVDMHANTGILQTVFDHRLINGARITPFIRAVHEEMESRVIPELETYLNK
ncbi:MAG: biotin/lipoyl-containing protein [bacterium]|nr:biotin/lipoyl-containing protein [bacterium]MDZ4285618.1 biotin/lipoyl-containing protein [Candidatus Sungbacteria bacterium]